MAGWLRREHEVYGALAGSFLAELVGLGRRRRAARARARGPERPPTGRRDWDEKRIDAVREALAELAAAASSPEHQRRSTESLARSLRPLADRGARIRAPFLSTRPARRRLARAQRFRRILRAAEAAPVSGSALCHLDVRSDNLCFRDGRAVLVDWNWASYANPDVDVAAWLPSVRVEGGPAAVGDPARRGELAAFVAGVWAAVAGLPAPETAPAVRGSSARSWRSRSTGSTASSNWPSSAAGRRTARARSRAARSRRPRSPPSPRAPAATASDVWSGSSTVVRLATTDEPSRSWMSTFVSCRLSSMYGSSGTPTQTVTEPPSGSARARRPARREASCANRNNVRRAVNPRLG